MGDMIWSDGYRVVFLFFFKRLFRCVVIGLDLVGVEIFDGDKGVLMNRLSVLCGIV
jgi:hypothetical protein